MFLWIFCHIFPALFYDWIKSIKIMFLWNFCHLFPVLFYDWNTSIKITFSWHFCLLFPVLQYDWNISINDKGGWGSGVVFQFRGELIFKRGEHRFWWGKFLRGMGGRVALCPPLWGNPWLTFSQNKIYALFATL